MRFGFMDRSKQLIIYRAQVINVDALGKAFVHTNRNINFFIKRNNQPAIQIETKSLILIYCAWVEASLSKLIHTPHGFQLCDIQDIKAIQKQKSIMHAWKKTLDIAIGKVNTISSIEKTRISSDIYSYINQYIKEPSELRNKLAHGQWIEALNSPNTDVNTTVTNALSNITCVNIALWKKAFEYLINIIEFLIESPDNYFSSNYSKLILEIKTNLSKKSHFKYEDKVAILLSKKK